MNGLHLRRFVWIVFFQTNATERLFEEPHNQIAVAQWVCVYFHALHHQSWPKNTADIYIELSADVFGKRSLLHPVFRKMLTHKEMVAGRHTLFATILIFINQFSGTKCTTYWQESYQWPIFGPNRQVYDCQKDKNGFNNDSAGFSSVLPWNYTIQIIT